ncbi:malonate decarboxylase subunit epsilon [Gallaecimonas xiamenensis]|uniref:[acyl-carrier-protein] S-malonyltransferase n=1 Tax=Gallaecimonas xiamenensis 3-C-1 TaxID=745411 RepID=K2JA12_9GAMM|nr:malonate decarboxylase subunit epsilon [Gallaecimonas xiamenensis]EKE71637.1 malonyl CoA-acyl carrier protein transacylase [Gallaecimonas xiamenensis 3-C-1]
MSAVFTCPGQGAQRPGMLQKLPAHPAAQAVAASAEAVLGQALTTLDSDNALGHSRNVQLSLLISSVAWGRYLLSEGCKPRFVLGLSIGAFPAAVLAESLTFEDALQLVALRGDLMQNAFPSSFGMMAVTGLDRYQVQALLERNGSGESYLANINADNQCVLSGSWAGLDALKPSIAKAGGHCQALSVTVPSHCPLLDEQALVLKSALDKVAMQAPRIGYVSASKARLLRDKDAIRDDLAMNMARQVHWLDASRLLAERGVSAAIELPPSGTLTGLFRRVLPQGHCVGADSTRLDSLQLLCSG